MLCQRCHKNLASVRYAEVVDGKVADLHLCQDCLARQQGESSTGFGLSGAAPRPKRSQASRERARTEGVPNLSCPACGTRLRDVLDRRRVGCATCYSTFEEHLDPLIRDMHVALIHRGKKPNLDDERQRKRGQLQAKRALLRSALKTENYEEAAQLRDTIQQMESTMIGPNEPGPDHARNTTR
ncbi:MAG: hypothetical protein AMXMBFR84_31260 [Candidatus Hydrogenedentota bacterium]